MLTSAILVAVIMFLVKTADHTLGQPLIERPLICGALVGLVLGDLQQGIIIGATLELIFLGTITIGGSVPADLAVGSVLATAFTILTHAEPPVAVALALPISLLAVFVYQVLKLVYTALVEKYDALLEQGRDRAALGLTLGMTFFYGIPFALIAFFGVLFGTEVIRSLVESIPGTVMRGMTAVGGILFFHRQRQAHNKGRQMLVGIEELAVSLKRLKITVRVVGVDFLQHWRQRPAVA